MVEIIRVFGVGRSLVWCGRLFVRRRFVRSFSSCKEDVAEVSGVSGFGRCW